MLFAFFWMSVGATIGVVIMAAVAAGRLEDERAWMEHEAERRAVDRLTELLTEQREQP